MEQKIQIISGIVFTAALVDTLGVVGSADLGRISSEQLIPSALIHAAVMITAALIGYAAARKGDAEDGKN